MQLKNIPLFTMLKQESMPVIIYKSRFIIAVVFATLLLLLGGCKKAIEQKQQNLFEDNILNRDFVVSLATDSGVDITTQFNSYTFQLAKNTLLDGPMTATNSSSPVINGTWSANDDYSKLTINLPSNITGFSFLNREWKFITKRNFPNLELAPWGTTDPKVLNMKRL
jgi:hypothetical protein